MAPRQNLIGRPKGNFMPNWCFYPVCHGKVTKPPDYRGNTKHDYTMNSGSDLQTREETTCEKDLGVYIDNVVKFPTHAERAANKGSQLVGMIRRSFDHLDGPLLVQLFKCTKLQKRDADVVAAYKYIDSAVNEVRTQRANFDSVWNDWFQDAETIATNIGSEIQLPRRSKHQRHRATTPAETAR